MNQPAKPPPQPTSPSKSPTVPDKHKPDGVPQGAVDEDAKGLPNSDRQDSETANRT